MTIATIGGRAGATFSGMEDIALVSSFPNTNESALGSYSEVQILRPDLSGISGPLTVNDAFWTINIVSGGSSGGAVPMRRCLRAWVESQGTWNNYSTGNAWATAGAAGSGTDRAASNSATLTYPGGFATGDIVSTSNATLIANLQDFFDGVITDYSELFDLQGMGISMSLPANATAATRPLLTIDYTAGGGGGPTVTQANLFYQRKQFFEV